MRRLLSVSLTIAAVAVFSATAASVPAAASESGLAHLSAQPVYIALGDSVAAGFGADSRATGYVGQLAEVLRKRTTCVPGQLDRARPGPAPECRQLQLVDLAVGGATTDTVISGQLLTAVDLMNHRNHNQNPRDDVRYVTITIGGNDVNAPILQACVLQPTPQCPATIQSVFAGVQERLTTIMASLRDAAGPDTVIVATAYANPLLNPGCKSFFGNNDLIWQAAVALANVALDGGTLPDGSQLTGGLNDITRAVAANYDVRIADAFGALTAGDLQPDCLHPDQSGYDIYETLFQDAILG